MTDTRLCIRLDLANGERIGPGKIAVLEARSVRRPDIGLREPAVSTRQNGEPGGWTVLTPAGEQVIELYHTIEECTRTSARQEFRAIDKLVRQSTRVRN
jgi:molybdate transport system regulatory protein